MTKATRIIPELTPEELERFWSHVDKKGPDDCWTWKLRGRWYGGYGKFAVKCKPYRAHVISYILAKGLTNGLFVRHSCHNPICVNPKHLKLGTPADNMRDKVEAGRQSRGEAHAASIKPKKGEDNPMAKLSNKEREEVLELWYAGKHTKAQLGRRFNVKSCTITKLIQKNEGTYITKKARRAMQKEVTSAD